MVSSLLDGRIVTLMSNPNRAVTRRRSGSTRAVTMPCPLPTQTAPAPTASGPTRPLRVLGSARAGGRLRPGPLGAATGGRVGRVHPR